MKGKLLLGLLFVASICVAEPWAFVEKNDVNKLPPPDKGTPEYTVVAAVRATCAGDFEALQKLYKYKNDCKKNLFEITSKRTQKKWDIKKRFDLRKIKEKDGTIFVSVRIHNKLTGRISSAQYNLVLVDGEYKIIPSTCT